MNDKELKKKNAPVVLDEEELKGVSGGGDLEIVVKNDSAVGIVTNEDVISFGYTTHKSGT